MRGRLRSVLVLAASLVLTAGGCLQIETRILVHVDGSATITERLQFSEQLLDMGSQGGPAKDLANLLTKEATLERMQQMGKGISLVSHEVREGPRRSRESVAVFKIPDISDFTYVSPYLALPNYPKHYTIKCTMFPVYEGTWWGRGAGEMGVTFAPASREPDRGRPAEPPPPPKPVDLQRLRDVQALFGDLMKDFTVKLTFESYAPLRFRPYYRYRGMRELTHSYDLIDFSDRNLDRYGGDFLGNQEIMLDLLRLQMGGPNVIENTKDHADNPTLPVFQPTGTPEIYFRPSRVLFDRYFVGKTLRPSNERPESRPANFDEIGFKGPADAPVRPASRPAGG